MAEKIAVVLAKDRVSDPEHAKLEQALLAELRHWPTVAVSVVPHLYDLSPDGPAVQLLRSLGGDRIVLSWLYPRAAFWVLNANGIKGRLGQTSSLPDEDADPPDNALPESQPAGCTLWCFDLRTHGEVEPYLDEIARIVGEVPVPAEVEASRESNGRAGEVDEPIHPRWYPVVDFERCTNCLECLNFCLFGVFGLGPAEEVVIEQPDACRTGCPACSRICPSGAIMFPQHQDPAIAGDPQAWAQGLKLDLSQLFSGLTPQQLAAAERERALAQERARKTAPEQSSPEGSAGNDQLDDLVDEVDGMDL